MMSPPRLPTNYSSKTYFGDAARDRQAAATLGYHFLPEGNGLGHEPCIKDYTDIRAVMAQIGL